MLVYLSAVSQSSKEHNAELSSQPGDRERRLPENREDRIKQQIAYAELVHEVLKSNAIRDRGISPDGGGYAIFEGSEEDGARIATIYVPF